VTSRFAFGLLSTALTACLLEVPVLHSQRGDQAAPPRVSQPLAREMAAEYRQLVDRYLAGDAESSVIIVKTWQVPSVETVQEHQAWDRTTLRAAALLETDAALALAGAAPRKFGIAVPTAGARSAADRLILAIRWLDRADKLKPADKSPFRRQWQVAVGRRLLSDGFIELASTILGDASLLFPSEPDVLLAFGTVREADALHIRAFIGETAGRMGGTVFVQRERAMLLDDAGRMLGRAFRMAPALAEARLRQAHVRMLRGNDGGARTGLEELRRSQPAPDVAYLAALMLGGIMDRRDDHLAAAALFREARQHVPDGQSALIAEALALRAAGRSRESTGVLREMLSRTAPGSDPWTRYPRGLDLTRASLDALRDEVKQQRSPPPPDETVTPAVVSNLAETFDTSSAAAATDTRVLLDVLVTRDHRPVTDLSAADFDVIHDEVRQQVALIDIRSLPVDVRIAIDRAAGLEGERLAHLKNAVRGIAGRARPGDRVELMVFSAGISLASGLTADREQIAAAADRVEAGRGTALFDALFTAIALPTSPARRTLSLVFTHGLDNASWLEPTRVIETAAGSQVTVYGVVAPEPDLPLRRQQFDLARLRKSLFQNPALMRDAFLAVLAGDTGGELLHAATDADLPATFADAVSRFRERYRLAYTPARQTSGVHTIDVRMKDKTLRAIARKTRH
jgi:VWFA-related protein